MYKANFENEAWIFLREEVFTVNDGPSQICFLLDAFSGACSRPVIFQGIPLFEVILDFFKKTVDYTGMLPRRIFILRDDPALESMECICEELKIKLHRLSVEDMQPFTKEFSKSLYAIFNNNELSYQGTDDDSNALSLIPKADDFCSCGSKEKFKSCCQIGYFDIVDAMNAAMDGDLAQALQHMKLAEIKLGETAEVICRYAICWSYFDREKSKFFLEKALELNANHPRSNYLLGIEAVAEKKYSKAVKHYKNAIANYPSEDKYHLNETYNNLGTAYFLQGKFKEAKASWEKGWLLLPSDGIIKNNLFDLIYHNPSLTDEQRVVSPPVRRFLEQHRPF